MSIVYLITKILTYPAAYFKGFWEHLTCRILDIPVVRGGYLRSNHFCGHVEHAPAQSAGKAFLLAFLPWLAQKLMALVFLTASAVPLFLFGLRGASETSFFWVELILLFIGLGFLCNAYPLRADFDVLWHSFYKAEQKPSIVARILLAPLNATFAAGAWLEHYGVSILIWFGAAVALYIVAY
ncbi:MAG: hypothetical protein LBS96_06735 [Oscillospiraceae bacterium]|jgi:hypothetical protein|nr:hypothetical protein [Oscillospiraceae bacterium]